MRLFEHPDFDQMILQAAEHFQLRPGIIEKDYYVTEVLRIIAATAGDKVIFKGGTSLSKGWNLIQRFSEDIDIFLDPLAFEPPLTKRGIDRELILLSVHVETNNPGPSGEASKSVRIGSQTGQANFQLLDD
ncbi:MAG: nucleotidyl transferase AbiEii/AbiGii toxin family protein, partial [Acidobacteriaceae bacterium]